MQPNKQRDKMDTQNILCRECTERSKCYKHQTYTERLNGLLSYFEEPEEDMITYISPEKDKASKTLLPVRVADSEEKSTLLDRPETRTRINTNSFSSQSLKEMENTTSMPKSEVEPRSIVLVGPSSLSDKSNDITKFSGGKYRPHEKHHFAKLNGISFTSCSSPDGAYSEVVLMFWLNNKSVSKYLSDRYRAIISLMYDSEEDLWSVSGKLVKRPTYSVKDDEEMQVSNRLCITSELRTEIKRILLFFNISPRQAYREFRKINTSKIVSSTSTYGYLLAETDNHSPLMKELDKTSSATEWGGAYREHEYPYRGYGGHLNEKEKQERYREHMDMYCHGD